MLAADELDLTTFDALADRGRAAARAGNQESAATLLSTALALWRGPALADVVASSDWLAAQAAALDERRLAVIEDHADALLATGRHTELTAELTRLVSQHELRERLRAQLMLALYRSGRQADALACFQRGRSVLADELGVDPGKELRELHQRILESDPGLFLPRSGAELSRPDPARDSSPSAVVPRQLPASVRNFVGREAELKELDGMLGSAAGLGGTVAITAIGGTGGIGKTALALHWAHQVAEQFPDGQLYVNLRGFDPGGPPVAPAEAVRGFLEALGVRPEEMPVSGEAQAGHYRGLLAGRRMLIVLDNARDAVQARPLLPASPGSLVLVTSRSALTGLAALDGAAVIALGLVSTEEAQRILAARLGQDRLAADPQAASDLIRYCGGLPLALAIAAARAAARPDMPLATLATAMAGESDRLDALETEEDAASIRAVLSWSYNALSGPAATMFRLLGVHPGPDITVPAAASLVAVSHDAARRLLAALIAASLLTEHGPGRYVLHDLVRTYAAEQAVADETEASRHGAIGRTLDHYLHSGWAACLAVEPASPLPLPPPRSGAEPEPCSGRAAALRWLRAEHHVLLRVATVAGHLGFDEHAWQIDWILALDSYLRFWDHDADLAAVNQVALAAARRLDDPIAIGTAYLATAFDERRAGLLDESIATYKQALACFERTGNLDRLADAHLGLTDALIDNNEPAEALHHATEAAAKYGDVGRYHGQSLALAMASWLHVTLGDPMLAREVSRQAISLCAERADRAFYAVVGWISAGYASLQLGDLPEAIRCYQHAISICGQHEFFAVDHADALFGLGDAHEAAGNLSAAHQAWEQALRILGTKNLRPLARHRWGTNPADRIRAKLPAAPASPT
jgi:tetratricopeptide (TPR) repeat protein